PGRKTQRLLAMLALGPARGVCRESLTEALWPGAEPASGRKALATELWRLKSALEAANLATWLIAADGRIGLSADARSMTDAVVFELAVATARATREPGERRLAMLRAEAAYSGEFMAGDGDEWCLGRRAYYAALRADLHLLALRLARETGDWTEVIRHGHALAMAEPLLEEAQQDVMRAHLALGNKAAALTTYRAFERNLRAELGLAPAEETRRLRLQALPPRFRPRADERAAPRTIADRLRRIADELDTLAR
ncbi:MAG: AfsR/SARP family transcriptional regulator, partial [Rhabdaerophilum sp.]